jgi:hypothetical protein
VQILLSIFGQQPCRVCASWPRVYRTCSRYYVMHHRSLYSRVTVVGSVELFTSNVRAFMIQENVAVDFELNDQELNPDGIGT